MYSQNPLNDPRFKEVLNQSGISVEDAKELLGKNANSDFLEEKKFDIPGKTKTSILSKNRFRLFRTKTRVMRLKILI